MEIIDFKGELPFRQKFEIDGKRWEIEFYYRNLDDTVMCNLFDDKGTTLSNGNSLRYGEPLFSHLLPDRNRLIRQDFPQKLLVPLSFDGVEIRVGKETFLNKVVITLQDVEWYIPTSGVLL